MRDVGGREPLRPEIDGLYDAFQHSRASRVELPLLGPAETRAYVAEVRDKALDALASQPAARPPAGRARLRLRHDRAARAAARRDDARHPPAARRRTRAARPAAAHAAAHAGRRARGRRGARPRRAVHHGHLHRAVGAGQRASRARRRPARLLDRHRPGHQRRVRGVRRRRRLRRPALVERARLGPPARGRPGRAAVLAARRVRHAGGGAGSGSWSRSCRRAGVHVCFHEAEAYARVGRQAAAHRGGVGEGRPVRPGDRAARGATRGATTTRRRRTPTSASATCSPPRRAPTRRARRRWACTS